MGPAERFVDYAKIMRSCIAHETDVEDAAMTNIYTDISRGIDKRLLGYHDFVRR